MLQPIPTDKSASTHVQTRERRAQITRSASRSDASRSIYWWLSPAIDVCVYVCVSAARYAHLDRTRPMPSSNPFFLHCIREGENDITPVMDAPSVRRRARYRARRDHVYNTPRYDLDDLARKLNADLAHADRRRPSRYIHARDETASRRSKLLPRKSRALWGARERHRVGLMKLDALRGYASCIWKWEALYRLIAGFTIAWLWLRRIIKKILSYLEI